MIAKVEVTDLGLNRPLWSLTEGIYRPGNVLLRILWIYGFSPILKSMACRR